MGIASGKEVFGLFQDLDGLVYDNAFRFDAPKPEDRALVFQGDAVLASLRDGCLTLPQIGGLGKTGESGSSCPFSFRYAFTLGSERYFLADGGGAVSPESLISSREYRNLGPKQMVFACAVGESLHRWYQSNRFCGRCGADMRDSETERARVCPDCGLTLYPKICPAVIVAVTDGDRLLLTKYQGRAFKRYALVAGFNEIGESIEDTVRREVREETGLHVKNLRFYKSQPWVFTDSLLMGFYCDLDGSDQITLQTDELSEGGWFHRAELPADHSVISLTGEMIERFRTGKEPR